MRKIYVASSWRNQHQPLVVSMLRGLGHEVYDFRNPKPGDNGFHWSEIDPDWEDWTVEEYRAGLQHPLATQGFLSDYEALQWADTCVLVLPCGRSAHLEAGFMVGLCKPLFVLIPKTEPIEPELMYLIAMNTNGDGEPPIVSSLEELKQGIEALS